VGKCNTDTTVCYYDDVPGCCHNHDDCDDGDDTCTDDACVDNECEYTFTGAEGCCVEFTWEKDFDSGGDQGFTFDNALGLGIGIPGFEFSIGWQVSGDCGFNSSPAALYYGMTAGLFGSCIYNIDLGFPLGLPNSGTATSAEFTLPEVQTYTLTLQMLADIQAGGAADTFSIEVVEGGAASAIWSKGDLGGNLGQTWHDVSLDLSDFAGKTVSLRFNFDTLGATGSGVGILVDDILLTADCNP